MVENQELLNLSYGQKQIFNFCIWQAYPLCYLDIIHVCDVYTVLNIWPILCFSVYTEWEVYA
jgi:hypothetical protein